MVRFNGKTARTTIYDRAALMAGRRYPGPAIITEYSATTVVPHGFLFHVDAVGNVMLRVQEKRRPLRRLDES
jgi:N-methylhydantoinase A